MKLQKYAFMNTTPDEWIVPEFSLKDINLFAGVSGVGKTRILSTIDNLGQSIHRKRGLLWGCWDVVFEIKRDIYTYHLNVKRDENRRNYISKEYLKYEDDIIFERDETDFIWEGKPLPKMGGEDIGLYLLRNEEKIKNVFNEFGKIYLRRQCPKPNEPPFEELGTISRKSGLETLEEYSLESIKKNFKHINLQMSLLYEFHHDIFKKIESSFIDIFPFVTEINIKPISEINILKEPKLPFDASIPVLVFKEKNIHDMIPQSNLSSGMIKTLYQLFDIYTMPENSIYMIDEIENSLGVNSLPAMVDILKNQYNKIQIILTSHHPYIIRNFDMKYWKVLRRKKNIVEVIDGESLKERFSKSSQDIFLQLVNSELIEEGI